MLQSPELKLAGWTCGLTLFTLTGLVLILSAVISLTPLWDAYTGVASTLRAWTTGTAETCWLCGMSRAFRCIWQGDWSKASQLNPNALTLFVALLAGATLGSIMTFGITSPFKEQARES